jgi:CRP/FNR family transcriptional regulator, anaerobic regulatory protein
MSERTCIDCGQCGLRTLCLLGRVNDEQRQRHRLLRIRRGHIASGQWLYRPGEAVQSVYALRSGCVKEIIAADCGTHHEHECVLGFALAGEVLGLTEADDPVQQHGAQAVAASHYCEIPWTSFRRLCADSLQASDELLRLLTRTATASQQTLLLMRGRDALAQLAGFLCNLSQRCAQRGLHECEFRLGMSRIDIAHYLGLTHETISRCFSELVRRGLIEVRAKQLRLLKPEALRQLFIGTDEMPALLTG